VSALRYILFDTAPLIEVLPMRIRLFFLALLVLVPLSIQAQAPRREIVVFGAASLTDVLGEIATAFTRDTGIPVKTSFAASSALARQIESGARADVFFPADLEWMDYLLERKLIQSDTRKEVVANRLVLIAPADSKVGLKIRRGLSLTGALAGGRLATGDPDSVPVGKYAQAALKTLGAWDQVEARLIRVENVRSALAFVARGEAALGIVYATDARAERKVRIVDTFPEDSHPPIRYPIAATSTSGAEGVRFVDYVAGAKARPLFVKYGFAPLP
jgi:molybdate transport system substrate-binding protein